MSTEATRRRALPHQTVLSPGPQSEHLAPPVAPDTGRFRSNATLAALAVARRRRRQAMGPGTGPTVTGRPVSALGPSVPRTLIGF